ncbi:MAG: MFS transporter [Anaerolineae bacterium]
MWLKVRLIYDLLRANRNLTVLLISIVLMEVVHGIELIALLPLYLTEVLGATIGLEGAVISAYMVVDILARTPAGWVADRLGRKPTLLAGIFLSLISIPLMMRAQSPHLLLFFNMINGLGAGCIWPAIYASVADTYGPERRGLILGVINTVMLGGLGLGPISGNFVLGLFSYRGAFLVCMTLVALVLLLVLMGTHETSKEQRAFAAGWDQESYAWVNVELALLGLVAFLLTIGLAFLIPIINLYGLHILRVTPTRMAFILLVPAIITALMLVPAGHLADRTGRKVPMVIGLALLSICFWGSPVSINPLVVSSGATLAGIGYALAVPAWNALAMDKIPSESRGFLLGVVAAVQGAGLALGPVIGAHLWERIDPYAPFLAAATVTSIATIVGLFVKDSTPPGPLR